MRKATTSPFEDYINKGKSNAMVTEQNEHC